MLTNRIWNCIVTNAKLVTYFVFHIHVHLSNIFIRKYLGNTFHYSINSLVFALSFLLLNFSAYDIFTLWFQNYLLHLSYKTSCWHVDERFWYRISMVSCENMMWHDDVIGYIFISWIPFGAPFTNINQTQKE